MPEGAIVVFSAHGVAPVSPRGGAAARPAHHRRDLPAGHQGAPRGAALRRRGLPHPADRARGPRGGRRDAGRGARAHHLVDGPSHADEVEVATRREGRVAVADHAVGRRDDRDRRPAARPGSRCCSTRPATTSATPPRTASWRSRTIAPRVRRAHRRRHRQLVELGAPRRGRRSRRAPASAYRVDSAARDRRGLVRRRRRRSGSPAGPRCPRSSCTGCSTGSRSAAGATSRRSHSAEEHLLFALPPELRRDLKAARPGRYALLTDPPRARSGRRSTASPEPIHSIGP